MDRTVYVHTLGFCGRLLYLIPGFTTLKHELTFKQAVFICAFLTWQDLEDRARMMKQRMKVMQEIRGSGTGSEYTATEIDSVDA